MKILFAKAISMGSNVWTTPIWQKVQAYLMIQIILNLMTCNILLNVIHSKPCKTSLICKNHTREFHAIKNLTGANQLLLNNNKTTRMILKVYINRTVLSLNKSNWLASDLMGAIDQSAHLFDIGSPPSNWISISLLPVATTVRKHRRRLDSSICFSHMYFHPILFGNDLCHVVASSHIYIFFKHKIE